MPVLKRLLTVNEVAWLVLAVLGQRPIDVMVNHLRNLTKKGAFGELPKLGDGRTSPHGYTLPDVVLALAYVAFADVFGSEAPRMTGLLPEVMRNNLDPSLSIEGYEGRALDYVVDRVAEGDHDFLALLHIDSVERNVVAGRVTRLEHALSREADDFWDLLTISLPIGQWTAALFPLEDHIDVERAWSGGR